MNMGLRKLLLLSSVLTFLFFNSMMVLSDVEIEDEHEFSYEEGSETGPENWWRIHEEWATCGNGTMQSPIDIADDHVVWQPELGLLRRFYRPKPAILKNRGHDIMLKWGGDAGSIWINETKYDLEQVHWHSPSEHTINGRRYSLEMHMVHLHRVPGSSEVKIAVVGILYRIGAKPDPFLARLKKYLKEAEDWENGEKKVGTVDPNHIREESRKYYRYMGSLTTPPCTEGVVWTILKQVGTVSFKQVKLLREAVHDGFEYNARPIQETNNRTIGLSCPVKMFGSSTIERQTLLEASQYVI